MQNFKFRCSTAKSKSLTNKSREMSGQVRADAGVTNFSTDRLVTKESSKLSYRLSTNVKIWPFQQESYSGVVGRTKRKEAVWGKQGLRKKPNI